MLISWILDARALNDQSRVGPSASDEPDFRGVATVLRRLLNLPALALDIVTITFAPIVLLFFVVAPILALVFVGYGPELIEFFVLLVALVVIWGLSFMWRRRLPPPPVSRWRAELLYVLQVTSLLVFAAPLLTKYLSELSASFLVEIQHDAQELIEWVLLNGLSIYIPFMLLTVMFFCVIYPLLAMYTKDLPDIAARAYALAWSVAFLALGLAVIPDGYTSDFSHTKQFIALMQPYIYPLLPYVALLPVAYYLRNLFPWNRRSGGN